MSQFWHWKEKQHGWTVYNKIHAHLGKIYFNFKLLAHYFLTFVTFSKSSNKSLSCLCTHPSKNVWLSWQIYFGIKLQILNFTKSHWVWMYEWDHMYQCFTSTHNLFPVKEGLICFFTPNIRDTDRLVKIRYTSNQPCSEKENLYYHSHGNYDQVSMAQIIELPEMWNELRYLPHRFSQKHLHRIFLQKEML